MSSATASQAPTPVWASETTLELPNTDIVSFAFSKTGTYDQERPVCGTFSFDGFIADQT